MFPQSITITILFESSEWSVIRQMFEKFCFLNTVRVGDRGGFGGGFYFQNVGNMMAEWVRCRKYV